MEEESLSEKTKATLEERRVLSVRILESLEKLEKSEEWHVLKELVFDEALKSIDRNILSEATRPVIDMNKIYTLQGERKWAKRYCDINRFVDFHKSLLEEINNQLK